MAEGVAGQTARELAAEVLTLLARAGWTVAVAESLTGGLVAAALTDVPGSSVAFRGGVVAYATELKAELLGVDAGMLAAHGPVYAPVAVAMAEGVRKRLGATVGLATTGVAGPGPQDGQPAGTVHIAVSFAREDREDGHEREHGQHGNHAQHGELAAAGEDDKTMVRTVALTGNRDQVRRLAVERVLGLLLGRLREECP
jgi:nicotinamide-nucleotide amidase